jgi:hypothetical protein
MEKLTSWIGVAVVIDLLIQSVFSGIGDVLSKARLKKFTMEFDNSQTTSSPTHKIRYSNTRN